jgi:NAD(P)-dependent dehydrogenase (short-subunit alcohol dehydrogenase family)
MRCSGPTRSSPSGGVTKVSESGESVLVNPAPDVFDLGGARAVVTGAARGIGRAAATSLAARGAEVVLFDVRAEDLEKTAANIAEMGGCVTTVVGDVTSSEDLDALFEAARGDSPVSVVVNCAGIVRRTDISSLTLGDLDMLWRVNVRGTAAVTLGFLPGMIDQGHGKIINVGSLGSVTGLEQRTAYATTKGAVALFTKSLANEVGRFGVCVNAIAPGYLETEMTMDWIHGDGERTGRLLDRIPLGRFGTPRDVGGLVVFLASSASDYVTGQIIMLDGGWTTS